MRTLQLAPHLTDTEIRKKLTESKGSKLFARWQILYLVQVGNMHAAGLIAPIAGLSVASVYKIVQRYNNEGADSVCIADRGGRRRALLTVAAERRLMSGIARKALLLLIRAVDDIRPIVESRTGVAVSDDYITGLLKRHGWEKKILTGETLSGSAAQRAVKLRRYWLPPSAI